MLFSSGHTITIFHSHQQCAEPTALTSWPPHLVLCFVLVVNSHTDGCEQLPHCGFHLRFPDGRSGPRANWPFVYLLWRNLCSSPLPIFDLSCWPSVVKSHSPLLFWIFIPHQTYDVWAFSPIFWVVFLLHWSNFFAAFLNVHKVQLLYFCCGPCAFVSSPRNHCHIQCSEDFALFSSKSFWISRYLFRFHPLGVDFCTNC